MLNDIPRCHYSSRDVTLGMSHDVTIHQEMSVNIRWCLYTSGDVSIHQVMSLYIRGCPHTSGDVSIHQMSLYIKCTIHHTMPVYIMWCLYTSQENDWLGSSILFDYELLLQIKLRLTYKNLIVQTLLRSIRLKWDLDFHQKMV